jgi:hypothetical protein
VFVAPLVGPTGGVDDAVRPHCGRVASTAAWVKHRLGKCLSMEAAVVPLAVPSGEPGNVVTTGALRASEEVLRPGGLPEQPA